MTENKATTPHVDDAVWGAAAIGKEINRNARQTFHLLESGVLPAKKVGKSWVASRRKLRGLISGDDEVAA